MSVAAIVPFVLLLSDEHLTRVASKVKSIAPVRATAERYYREQGLAINEVDYKGQNLAMYLSSLSDRDERSFQQWTSDNFGFSVQVQHSTGHVEISIRERGSNSTYNLADIGFGFSQILPIVAQLWSMVFAKDKNTIPMIFTIEQPELHLHPSFQSKVADGFISAVKVAKHNNIDLRLIIETHSEAIVNRIGNQIASVHPEIPFFARPGTGHRVVWYRYIAISNHFFRDYLQKRHRLRLCAQSFPVAE